MGDIHGDLMQCIRALRAAGVTDETGGKWTGGDTIFVQVRNPSAKLIVKDTPRSPLFAPRAHFSTAFGGKN